MRGSWTSSVANERVRADDSRRLSTSFDRASLFRAGRMGGKSGIVVVQAEWPVGAEALRILSLITPQNRAG